MANFSEFQKLKSVIVGKGYSALDYSDIQNSKLRGMLEKIATETDEDCEKLSDFLKSCGVKVYRPAVLFDLKHNKWNDNSYRPRLDLQKFGFSFPNQPLMPRDTAGVYGQTIIEFFTKNTGRFFDNWHYQDIFKELYKDNHRWISMPMPLLKDGSTDYNESYKTPLFHAANILKCGKDLFYTRPKTSEHHGKGNPEGVTWIERELGGQFTLNPIPAGGHADGKIALLKPGLLMCWNPDHLPEKLKAWDKIIVPDTFSQLPEEFRQADKKRFVVDFVEKYSVGWINYCDSTVFDVNCFSVSEELVVVNGHNKDVFDQFKKHKIEPWILHFRHQHFWDGAIHCITLDLEREDKQEDYFA